MKKFTYYILAIINLICEKHICHFEIHNPDILFSDIQAELFLNSYLGINKIFMCYMKQT